MKVDSRSVTAVMVAAARACYAPRAGDKIFDDTHAHRLLTEGDREAYEGLCIGALERVMPTLAASCSDRPTLVYHAQREGAGTAPLLIRARYVEDALFQSLARGIRQYVIVGAGLDTFAWRRPDAADRLQVFEIDHPATQQFKRERLDAAGLHPPPHLHFAPADLERERLAEVLARTSYDATLPAFFAWLGVSMYLSQNSIVSTFRSISTVGAPGSELVFDYFEPPAFAPDAPLRLRYMMQRVHEFGEPMVSGLDPVTLRSELAAAGLQLVEDLGPREATERFLKTADGFRATEYWHLARAIVTDAGSVARLAGST